MMTGSNITQHPWKSPNNLEQQCITESRISTFFQSNSEPLKIFRSPNYPFYKITADMATRFFNPPSAESLPSVFPALLYITFAIIAIATFSFVQLLKPVDKHPPPKGKAWKLPPGPQGLPVIGNLLLYMKGEDAVCKQRLKFIY